MQANKKQDDFIYGRHPVIEALKSGKRFEKILFQKGLNNSLEQIIHLAKSAAVYIQFVPVEKLNRITRKAHQGVIGFTALVDYYEIEDILPHIYERGETPLLILLDGVTDVRNVGAIARTVACSGAHALIFPQKGSAQINSDTVKASAGGINKIYLSKVNSLEKAIKYLQLNGLKVIATDIRGAKNISSVDFSGPSAIVMGGEEKGVSDEVVRYVDEICTIPMPGEQLSYNVSVASGMVLYEAMRQRMNM